MPANINPLSHHLFACLVCVITVQYHMRGLKNPNKTQRDQCEGGNILINKTQA